MEEYKLYGVCMNVYELFRKFRAPKIIQMRERHERLWKCIVSIARKKIEMTRRFLPRQVQQSQFLFVCSL